MQTRSISRNALITQPTNRNVGFCRKSEAEPDRRTRKFEMPPVVQIIPRASTGKNDFKWEAHFDMSRTKLIVLEDVEKCLGVAEIITYPGQAFFQQNGVPNQIFIRGLSL